MLKVENLVVRYGVVTALSGLSLNVAEGETVAVVGPNGAGKTTLVRTISGLARPASGDVIFEDRSLATTDPATIVRRGIAHVPEGAGVLKELSVRDNLMLAGRDPEAMARVLDAFPILDARADQSAGSLSGGERQMLGIAKGLLLDPKLLILDEPSFGLAPKIVSQVFEILRTLRNERRMALLIVEQNIEQSLRLADRGYVLQAGECVLSGPGQQLADDPETRRRYMALT